MSPTAAELAPLLRFPETRATAHFGFRFGDRGTHTSRTLMLDELETVLAKVPSVGSGARWGSSSRSVPTPTT